MAYGRQWKAHAQKTRHVPQLATPYDNVVKKWYIKGAKKYYMKSKWEYNYALYLDFLVSKGLLLEWEYEPDAFWFESIKSGIRKYTPDFKLYNLDGSIEYREVKGWMDSKSKTKLKRMAKYYPNII